MAISQLMLKRYMAGFPETMPRLQQLEKRIQIGTGYHNKWYSSQKEHMLGWMQVQAYQTALKGGDESSAPARLVWNRLKCSPSMFWLAEAAGAGDEVLSAAEKAAVSAAAINPMDGEPHGKMMRQVLPWDVVSDLLIKGPPQASEKEANTKASEAFSRLAARLSFYRKMAERYEKQTSGADF